MPVLVSRLSGDGELVPFEAGSRLHIPGCERVDQATFTNLCRSWKRQGRIALTISENGRAAVAAGSSEQMKRAPARSAIVHQRVSRSRLSVMPVESEIQVQSNAQAAVQHDDVVGHDYRRILHIECRPTEPFQRRRERRHPMRRPVRVRRISATNRDRVAHKPWLPAICSGARRREARGDRTGHLRGLERGRQRRRRGASGGWSHIPLIPALGENFKLARWLPRMQKNAGTRADPSTAGFPGMVFVLGVDIQQWSMNIRAGFTS